MKPFCEVITTRVLPAIRSIMTRELLTTYGLTQKEVAELLGLTQAAISQYNREARGFRVELLEAEPEVMRMIKDLTRDVATKGISAKKINSRFCEICKKIREKGMVCSIHEDIYPSIAPCSNCLHER